MPNTRKNMWVISEHLEKQAKLDKVHHRPLQNYHLLPIIAIHTLHKTSSPMLSPSLSPMSLNPAKHQKNKDRGIAGERAEFQLQTPTRWCTVSSAPLHLPLRSPVIIQDHQKGKQKKKSQQDKQLPNQNSLQENNVFMDDNQPPPV